MANYLKKLYVSMGLNKNSFIGIVVKKMYSLYLRVVYNVNYKWFLYFPDSFIKHVHRMRIHGGERFVDMTTKFLPLYLNKHEMEDKKLVHEIKKDMLSCYFLYGINPEEYLIHSFRNKPKELRQQYLSKKTKDENIMKQLGCNKENAFNELKNKYLFYQLVPAFFKRDVCYIDKKTDVKMLESFVNRHTRFIAKPINGRFGKGTRIIDMSDYKNNEKVLLDELQYSGEWIIEELIEQDERISIWNESSVNTVRIPSFRTQNGIKIMRPFFRLGRKGCVVDNAGSGGIFFSIDADTGKICSLARDESGNVYESNPDNGLEFKDWCIPEWGELLNLTCAVHNSLPVYHKYVGFDFALSKNNGWQLVEGNWGDFICQQSTLKIGLKEEFLKLLYN